MPFPVDVRFTTRTEERLGVRFPPEFVLRMTRDNGGELVTDGDAWQLHPFFDDIDRKHLKRTCNDIVRETARLRELQWFPQTAVVVGTNGGGDHIVFLPSGHDSSLLDSTLYSWSLPTGELVPVGDTCELFD